ncbi:MAG: DUF6305 family protein [Treponema sp.]|nr:DUF6305 family protein [Treponema sp.]
MKKIICLIFAVLLFGTASWAQQGGVAIADVPAVLTSVGQSADIEMVRVLLTRAGVQFRANALIYANGLEAGDRTLILVVGGSSKGLGAAGISADDEMRRAQDLVSQARNMGMQIIAVHVGGEARRGPLSDRFINFAVPAADYVIAVSTGDNDGLLTSLANQAGIPFSRVDRIAAAGVPLADAFVTLIASGNGLNIRHLVEGAFGFLDTMLVIVTAMVFMRFLQESGGLDAVSFVIIKRFKSLPVILLPMLMLVSMFPGMITGSSSASVLTAGAIVAPILIILGVPLHKAGAFIAMAGILGMIAPPVNIPAKIIGSGIDMPFTGFTIPLLLLTIPPAIVCAWVFALKYVKKPSWEEIAPKLKTEGYKKHGPVLFVPIAVVVALMVLGQVLPMIFSWGLPVIFLIGAASDVFIGNKFNALKAAKQAVNDALPVLGILAGVGMFIQVMTLSGVRGFIVVNALSVNPALLYGTIAVSMPLFGIVSAFGSASVLGTPFSLALLGGDHIIVVSALSMIAGMGDFMPPTALSAIFAAQVIGETKYSRVLKKLIIPALAVLFWALLFLIFSREVRSFISW